MQEMQETRLRSLSWEDALEEGMATHSSILAWRIPWAEESGGLQSMGLQKVGHDWAHSTFPHFPTLDRIRWLPDRVDEDLAVSHRQFRYTAGSGWIIFNTDITLPTWLWLTAGHSNVVIKTKFPFLFLFSFKLIIALLFHFLGFLCTYG